LATRFPGNVGEIKVKKISPHLEILPAPQRRLWIELDQVPGASFNPQITLKSLSYFDDGDLRSLPEESRMRLVAAARDVDLDQLPVLSPLIRDKTEDLGGYCAVTFPMRIL
jgi:hypothetical protein